MKRNNYLAALDGLRGVAAIYALLHHVFNLFNFDTALSPVLPLRDHMHLLVDCFYAMSGFVIALSFDRKMAEMPFLEFMLLRVIRLYPMVVIGVAIGTPVLILQWKNGLNVSLADLLAVISAGMLLIPTTIFSDVNRFIFPVNGPHWSLFFEMVLCAAYALTIGYLRGRALIAAIVVTALAVVAASYLGNGLNVGFLQNEFLIAFGRVAYPFTIGVWLCRSSYFVRDTNRSGYLAIVALTVVLINPIPASWVYDAVVSIILLPLIVIWVANARDRPALNGVASWLGELSYPLYAIHFPIVALFAGVARRYQFGMAGQIATASACVAAAILAAAFLYKRVDVPVRAFLIQKYKDSRMRAKRAT